MAEGLTETQQLITEVVNRIETAVGATGMSGVHVHAEGEPHEFIRLSRGGLVVEGGTLKEIGLRYRPSLDKNSLPVYRNDLAVVTHSLGRSVINNTLGSRLVSRNDVFDKDAEGLWLARHIPLEDAQCSFAESIDLVTTYYMGKARRLRTRGSVAFVLGLCDRFDSARQKNIEHLNRATA